MRASEKNMALDGAWCVLLAISALLITGAPRGRAAQPASQPAGLAEPVELIQPTWRLGDSWIVETLTRRVQGREKEDDDEEAGTRLKWQFKVAKIENMYAVLDVDERDVHEIGLGMTGEIAFVSRPELKFPIAVDLLEPVALTKEEGNVFPVRCRFTGEVEAWWRPGMSGIAKIDVGKRNILWIFTHRTVDFFRLFLWW